MRLTSCRIDGRKNNGRKAFLPRTVKRLTEAKRVTMYVRAAGRDWLV